MDPFYEATFQCGLGINEKQTMRLESKTYMRHKKSGRRGTKRKIPPVWSKKTEWRQTTQWSGTSDSQRIHMREIIKNM